MGDGRALGFVYYLALHCTVRPLHIKPGAFISVCLTDEYSSVGVQNCSLLLRRSTIFLCKLTILHQEFLKMLSKHSRELFNIIVEENAYACTFFFK